eukprot:CAMPEP_0171109844 /NCGR_PEP_ID=MMETSP0766_2-20121228/71012_1 /TAXON_ID=439317 /ORGANISM="Gambierdiscus australes, Strain CAWD 149" /LENGTH=222 /DNA_ID=CAMNT_0011571635 /DNA_START=52 /DNA_END=720 /DNA_ORIENTATION=+
MAFVWRSYRLALQRRPLLTKATTSASLMALSDAMCQGMESSRAEVQRHQHQRPAYDWDRSARLAAIGLVYNGPLAHAWYQVLERMVQIKHPAWGLGCKMLLDAVVYSPPSVVGYVALKSRLEGSDWRGVRDEVRTKWWPGLVASWSFWPAANLVIFALAPLQLRVLCNNALALGWNAILWNVTSEHQEAVKDPLRSLQESLLSLQQVSGDLSLHFHLGVSRV